MKTQVIIEQETKKIIATSFSLGKKHDYALFKESKIPVVYIILRFLIKLSN
ncbi:hypothetical protein [Spiroplasma poulsonii]|uniref:hypothetical protein n=1 Tax=Spiroplasma poulsonii TaxID=2138 RepID=UPI0034DCC64D